MKRLIICGLTLLMLSGGELSAQATDYTKFVDPVIGADDGGYTTPGPAPPSGMVFLKTTITLENGETKF